MEVVEVPISFRVELTKRFDIGDFGSVGQSLSGILRQAIAAGAYDTAMRPGDQNAFALQLETATKGSLVATCVLTVAAVKAAEIVGAATKKAIVDVLAEGIKKTLNQLLGRTDTKDTARPENLAKLLEKVDDSTTNLARILESVNASSIQVDADGKRLFVMDRADIEAFTVPPEPGAEVAVVCYPLSLHQDTHKGWLRITGWSEDDYTSKFGLGSYRVEIENSNVAKHDALFNELARVWSHNSIQKGRNIQKLSLVLRPSISRNGLVRSVTVVGFA